MKCENASCIHLFVYLAVDQVDHYTTEYSLQSVTSAYLLIVKISSNLTNFLVRVQYLFIYLGTQALLEELSHIINELSMKDPESSIVGRYSSSLLADWLMAEVD
jgi:hypothetical protein